MIYIHVVFFGGDSMYMHIYIVLHVCHFVLCLFRRESQMPHATVSASQHHDLITSHWHPGFWYTKDVVLNFPIHVEGAERLASLRSVATAFLRAWAWAWAKAKNCSCAVTSHHVTAHSI